MDLSRLDLPLVPYLPRISASLDSRRVLALSADPGAGKSTLVPLYLMGEGWLRGGKIVMLEPRRLAAAAIAARISDLLDEPVGGRAGYRVRGSARVSPRTRIEVVTEALLTRMIQQDPLLGGISLVIIDEFHERSIHADLALALALEVRRARPDLALLVMSATMDVEAVARLIAPGAGPSESTLTCPGALHPVETRYEPLGEAPRWEERFADGLARLFEETEGDILAFLPGAGEIRRTGARLGGLLAGRADVLPLHGLLPLSEQRRIASRSMEGAAHGAGGAGSGSGDASASDRRDAAARRRVILSTSIAETSLTVPGIRVVADAGWARLSRFHPATGLDRLVTERVSTSSADQRRGRAGRLGPGLCVRFWSESENLQPHEDPEILRSDLSGLVLECALWGAKEPGALSWMDAPAPGAWSQAREILLMLGLLERGGPTDAGVPEQADPTEEGVPEHRGPTEAGRRVAGLGLPPRLGVLATRGADGGQPFLAAACAALLEDRDSSGVTGDPDFRLRLELLRTGSGNESWRRNAIAEMGRIARRLGINASGSQRWSAEEEGRVGNLLAYAFPDRIARREPDRTYRLVTGRAARFPGVSRASTPWICAPDADAGETTGMIRLAAPVEPAEAERVLAAASEERLEIRWEGLVPKGYLVRRAGRLSLTERPMRPPEAEIAVAFRDHLRRKGLDVLPWSERSRSLLQRMRFYAKARPDAGLGDLGDSALAADAPQWLEPFLSLGGGQVLGPERLFAALRGLLGRLGSRAGRFDSEVPESITLPTGGRRKIEYASGEPAVEARIQEVFGLAESPRICGVPLTFRLLSPARRPLQITRDLAGFWRETYAEVRKEMRGRYPKHSWPEDPTTAVPTSGVRPR